MEKFPALLAICAGNSPITGEFSAQGPATRSLGVFFGLWYLIFNDVIMLLPYGLFC